MPDKPRNYIQARVKPLSEIPKEFACCDGMRQRFMGIGEDILQAIPNSLFQADIECPFCHRILHDMSYMKIKRNGEATCIAVACYEFDEGPPR